VHRGLGGSSYSGFSRVKFFNIGADPMIRARVTSCSEDWNQSHQSLANPEEAGEKI
jgi:hypothetical protein